MTWNWETNEPFPLKVLLAGSFRFVRKRTQDYTPAMEKIQKVLFKVPLGVHFSGQLSGPTHPNSLLSVPCKGMKMSHAAPAREFDKPTDLYLVCTACWGNMFRYELWIECGLSF